jgi:SAM-dependent methyltransferase
MVDRELATNEQERVFGSLWTRSHNLTSRISYVRASPFRVLLNAFRSHRIPRNARLSILEYGFGHGRGLFCFDRPASLHGVELSDSAIRAATKKARKKCCEDFDFKRPPTDDPVRVEFPSDRYDVVICSHTIEHVYSDEKLLAELFRVLKPGGKCFLLVPTEANHPGLLAEELQRQNPNFPDNSYHVWLYNPETFQWLAEKAGFSVLEMRSLDAILDQRLEWKRPLQISAGLLFSVLPYRVWEWLDGLSQRRGFHPRQCLIVATKVAASGDVPDRAPARRPENATPYGTPPGSCTASRT